MYRPPKEYYVHIFIVSSSYNLYLNKLVVDEVTTNSGRLFQILIDEG